MKPVDIKENKYNHPYTEKYFKDRSDFYTLYYPLCNTIAMILVKIIEPQKSLEIGCGTGFFVHALQQMGVEAFGVDISEYAINNTLDGTKTYFKCVDMDTEQLPYVAGAFDLVTSLRAMEHLNNPQKAINEIARVLKPSGFVAIIVPTSNLWRRTWYHLNEHSRRTHINVIGKSEWLRLFKSCGLNYRGNFLNIVSKDLLNLFYVEEMKLHYKLLPSTSIGKLLCNLGKLGKISRARANIFMWRGESMLFQKES